MFFFPREVLVRQGVPLERSGMACGPSRIILKSDALSGTWGRSSVNGQSVLGPAGMLRSNGWATGKLWRSLSGTKRKSLGYRDA